MEVKKGRSSGDFGNHQGGVRGPGTVNWVTDHNGGHSLMGAKRIRSRLGESEFGFKLFKVIKSSSHQSIPSENMSWTHEEGNT